MTEADLLIFSCPTFCDNMPGYYKSFLDHFAFMWMLRRPNRIMFKKKAIIISTDENSKAKSTIKEIEKNLSWWGISNIYKYGNYIKNVNESEIEIISNKLFNKVINKKGKVSIKTKLKFYYSKIKLNKNNIYNYNYWTEEGFLKGKKPW